MYTYGCQWNTVSTVGCPPASIKVYDSAHGNLSLSTKKVITDLMLTEATAISVYYFDVQQQSGGNDCALFALAFVADLCTIVRILPAVVMITHEGYVPKKSVGGRLAGFTLLT